MEKQGSLTKFADWMTAQGKTTATVRAYVMWVRKIIPHGGAPTEFAVVLRRNFADLRPDQQVSARSAWGCFTEYAASRGKAVPPLEPDADEFPDPVVAAVVFLVDVVRVPPRDLALLRWTDATGVRFTVGPVVRRLDALRDWGKGSPWVLPESPGSAHPVRRKTLLRILDREPDLPDAQRKILAVDKAAANPRTAAPTTTAPVDFVPPPIRGPLPVDLDDGPEFEALQRALRS